MNHRWLIIGFDYKVKNTLQNSIDAFVWEQDESVVEKLSEEGITFTENLYQFWNDDVSLIEKYSCHTTAVAFAVSEHALETNKELNFRKEQRTPYSSEDLISRGWQILGYDVADANGYFSIIGMGIPDCTADNLFEYAIDAEALVPIANSKIPEHSPFAVFMILAYQNRVL